MGHSSTRNTTQALMRRRQAGSGGARRWGERDSVALTKRPHSEAGADGQARRRFVRPGRGASKASFWYRAAIMASVTCSRGRSNTMRPARRPTMRGKLARATSTWCRLHTRVALRAAASCCRLASVSWDRVGSSADSGSSTRNTSRIRQQQARQAAALALAAGQAVDPRIQLVAQAEALQGLEGGLGIGRFDQRARACHTLHWGRRAASTAVTTRWRGGRGGVCGARHWRARSWWRAVSRQGPGIVAKHLQAAHVGRAAAGQGRQQAGFAGAGRADHGQLLALRHHQVDGVEGRRSAGRGAGMAHGQLVEPVGGTAMLRLLTSAGPALWAAFSMSP